MRGLNQLQIIGNVGKDPEMHTTEAGNTVARFSVAINSSYTNKSGEKVEHTEWVNVVAWNKLGEIVAEYVKKGTPLYLSGRIATRSFLHYSKIAEKKSTILKNFDLFTSDSKLRTPDYYLVTLHRAENTDDPKKLNSILRTLDELSKTAPVIFPLHPRTRKMVKTHHLISKTQKVKFVDPVSYLNMLMLEKNAKAILTDSGGVQKEAYWLGVPCVTLRDETEWKETVQSGWNVLVGTDFRRILKGVKSLERRKSSGREMDLFGDGKTGGLLGMQERVELSGGSFAIESSIGKGTVIRASWPASPQDR